MQTRIHRGARLAACAAFVLGSVALTAGCGGSSSSSGSGVPTPSAAAPNVSSSQYQALVPLIDCLRQHGLNLPAQPNMTDVRQAYQALPADKQQAVIQACRTMLPPGLMGGRGAGSPSS